MNIKIKSHSIIPVFRMYGISAIPEEAQNGAILVARRDWTGFPIGSMRLLYVRNLNQHYILKYNNSEYNTMPYMCAFMIARRD